MDANKFEEVRITVMELKKKTILLSLGVATMLMGATTIIILTLTPAEVLSSGGTVTGGGLAYKTKLVGMSNGLMVSVYGDTVEGAGDAYDLKDNVVHKARDIFVRTCMPSAENNQCSAQSSWSAPVNISNTAKLTSASSRFRVTNGVLGAAEPFYGDSDKPNISNVGTYAVVTWVDKYCGNINGGNDQRIVSYAERSGLSVPFSCMYESHINFADVSPHWVTRQLTSGERDAKQDASKGVVASGKAKWIATWQEDPRGLQIGGGDGPGDGASGANVTHGTDIWQSVTGDLNATPFSTPTRLTDNFIKSEKGDSPVEVYAHDGVTGLTTLDSGITGASRANNALVAQTTGELAPTVVVTYEESKGSEKVDEGKFIRYHAYPFTALETNASGAIISNPKENARRVRFVTQTTPGTANGMRMGIFWREGKPVEGGPGDVVLRLGVKDANVSGSTGLKAADMIPAVDPAAAAKDYTAAIALNNTPAYNISSNTIPWTPVGGVESAPTNTLTDATDKNAYEDARAHRAVIRGDDFFIGYSYAKDWAVATATNLDNYNFWMRSFNAVDGSWSVAKNLSNVTDKKINVKEPRLVGMPGSSADCNVTTNPESCQNPNVLLVAWGTESNVYSQSGEVATEGNIYYIRTKDKGLTFTTPSVVPGIGTSNRSECQLRTTPAGNIVTTVWNEKNNDKNGTYSMLSVSTAEDVIEPLATASSSDSSTFDALDNTSLIAIILGFLGVGAFITRRKLAKKA